MKHLLIALVLLLLASCSSHNFPTVEKPIIELTSIKQKYTSELSSITVGDYISAVSKKFPEMFVASDNMKNTIYEFDFQQQYYLVSDKSSQLKSYKQTLRFYFVNKK